jgi:hypothetical protein
MSTDSRDTHQGDREIRIKDATGRWSRVLEERGNTYVVAEFWQFVHKNNVVAKRYWSETLKKYVSIPED